MHEQPAQRGAALAGGAHGGEGDAAHREIEVGRGRDDGGVVAAEFENRAGKPRREPRRRRRGPWRSSRWPTPAATRGSSTSTSPISRPPIRSSHRPSGASPKRRMARATRAWTASAVSGVFSEGFHTTGSPQTSASAAFHDHTATGKLNAEMTPHDAQRMPGLHHPVVGPLGGDGAGRRAGATARPRSRRCRSSPGPRRAPRRRSCRPRA